MSSEHASIADIQTTHLDTYRSNPDRIESDAGTERQDRADYDGRFIFELLQNAVDEMGDTAHPEVRLELTEDRLVVANNGTAFTIDDLYALTLTTRTTKAGDTSIGHKGRGFTSVLGITDRPAVYSSDVAAQFDRQETATRLNDDTVIAEQYPDGLTAVNVPVLGMPCEATPSAATRDLLDDGFTTVFEFPLRDPDALRGRIERKLRGLGENTVALLPELERIRIETPEWERTWRVRREPVDNHPGATFVHLACETSDADGETREERSFAVFETDDLDYGEIVAESNLGEVELDTMGGLSVGVGFTAEPVTAEPSTAPDDWRITPVYGASVEEPPHVHVFLPTKERSPIPALVTGTFQSDTSRRNLTLDYDEEHGYAGQFNAALFGEVGDLFAERVVPFVDESATSVGEFLESLDPSLGGGREWSFTPGSVEHCLFSRLSSRIGKVPLVPTHGSDTRRTITELVLPHTTRDSAELGTKYADIMGQDRVSAGEQRGYLPATDLLTHRTTATLAALGATRLPPHAMPTSLAVAEVDPDLREHVADGSVTDPETATGTDETTEAPPARLWVDPVLVYLVEVRKTLESDDEREVFDAACRSAKLFPTGTTVKIEGTRTAMRMESGELPFFLPPEEDVESGSLPTLAFLARELYHGTDPGAGKALRETHLPSEFRSELENIWQVDRFSFERVFDAAVRPQIPGPNSRDVDTTPLESRETLETIRKLAAVGSPENERDPREPLLYRSSRRSFFELSKLPIPAVSLDGGDVTWQPAHRVYVSREWQAALGRDEHAHVEPLLTAVGEATNTQRFDPWVLPPLDWFGVDPDDVDAVEEWVAFFRWLGVAEHLRPLPLFAPDAATRHRYRKTKGFDRPPRSGVSLTDDLVASEETDSPVDPRYNGLTADEWERYREHLMDNVDPEFDVEEHGYLYQVNPLEYADEIIKAAAIDDSIGNYLLEHLAVWWGEGLGDRQHALAAEFTNNRWRGSNRSYFFRSKERRRAGMNLWVWQLRQHDWVPTSQGTVAPQRSWLLSATQRGHFSLQLDRDRPLLPFADALTPTGDDSPDESFTSTLGIGTRLERDQFSPTDVACVLTSIRDHLRNASVTPARFAGEIELLYTRVAELLPALEAEQIADPEWTPGHTGLHTVPVLCRSGDTYGFREASSAYFVRSHSERERYENLDLPLIVLFKPEAARFGTHLEITDTDDVVTQTPIPGDDVGFPATIDGVEIDESWLQTVLVALLLRLRSDRPSAAAVDQDTNNTRRFFQQLELVGSLELELRTSESIAEFGTDTRPQPYHIKRENGTMTAVLVDGSLSETAFLDALARAYTDYLDVPQYYEGVYNLVDHAFGTQSPEARLLDRLRVVGNGVRSDQFDVVGDRLFGKGVADDIQYKDTTGTTTDIDDAMDGEETLTAEVDLGRDPNVEESTSGAGSASTSRRVPDVESLTRIGERRVYEPGTPTVTSTESSGQQRSNGGSSSTTSSGGGTPASQEYRTKIDEFGMALTMESERDRLRQAGEDRPETKVWDVSTPERYSAARGDSDLLTSAIDNFVAEADLGVHENPFDTDWPGFDVLTVVTNETGAPMIGRCIELKTSGLKTRKPSLSWNEWKAARSTLAERYYLYVARNIRIGKADEATLLEIPRPFQTLTKHRRERRDQEVQLDLRSFDFEDDTIVERPVQWEE